MSAVLLSGRSTVWLAALRGQLQSSSPCIMPWLGQIYTDPRFRLGVATIIIMDLRDCSMCLIRAACLDVSV